MKPNTWGLFWVVFITKQLQLINSSFMYSLTEAKIKEKKKVIIRSASNLFVKYAQNESRYNIQQKKKNLSKFSNLRIVQ